MKKILSLGIALTLLLVHGCAKGVPPEDISRIRGKKVIAVAYAPSGFAVAKGRYLDAFYGMVGLGNWTEAVGEGRRWVADYALPDPSVKAVRALLAGMKKLDMEAASFHEFSDEDPAALKKAFGPGGFVLDIKTTRWMLTYFPADATRYRLTYEARARLISLEDSGIIWKSRCRYTEGDINKSATLYEFEANHAALLRERLGAAADACASALGAEFFGKGD